MTADAHGRFAALLHQRRREAGLTQKELASRAGVAVRTVRDAERGRTVRPQRTTARLLADGLQLQGVAREEFLAAIRPPGATVGTAEGDAPERPAVPSPRTGDGMPGPVPLPPAPALIGRDAEVAELAKLVEDLDAGTGPVTLVGLVGVGKTALALAVAHRVAARFPAGVAGVTIDEHGDAAEALASVAFVFGVADLTELAVRVARQPGLLLLDAAQRAPAKVREVLSRVPRGLRVLVAGHAPVGLAGERVWPVGGLELPPPAVDVTLAEIADYPAVALLLDRLARVRVDPLADDEVPALVGLVRRLGGLPLALELAAAHGRLLRLPEILQRYGDRVLDLGSATQTLREAVAGSYRLLDEPERRALRRLAVFRHRWSMELAEQMLGDIEDPVPVLDRLVSMGLVAVSGAREHRFRMLDVVREFATEQAVRYRELASARRDHARVIALLAERAAPELAGGGMRAAAARLDDLAPDLWAALNHAANDDPRTALRLASQLPRWWRFRGRDVTGRRWLRRLLDDPRTADADPLVRAWAQVGLAQLANEHGDGASERDAAVAALAEFQRLGDVPGELTALNVLSAVGLTVGDPEDAREHTERAWRVASRMGRLREAAIAQMNLTWHEIRIGDLATARRRLATVDRLAARSGEDRLRVLAAANLAEVNRLQGRYEEAVSLARRVLPALAEVGDPGHRRRVSGTLGQALACLGRVAEATRVLATLRAEHAGSAAMCAAIEGRVAVARGEQARAAEWFEEAAVGFRRGQDRRDLLEALVGLAAYTPDRRRRAEALADLSDVAEAGGFTLLPAERELLDRAPAADGDPGE